MDVFGLCDAEESFLSAESLLIQLGFGGPSQGLDRIPQRFLQASQVFSLDGFLVEILALMLYFL